MGGRTLRTEELAGDVESLRSNDHDLLAAEQLLGHNAGQATQKVPLAVDDDLRQSNCQPHAPNTMNEKRFRTDESMGTGRGLFAWTGSTYDWLESCGHPALVSGVSNSKISSKTKSRLLLGVEVVDGLECRFRCLGRHTKSGGLPAPKRGNCARAPALTLRHLIR